MTALRHLTAGALREDAQSSFYIDDVARFSDNPKVNVIDYSKLSEEERIDVLNREGDIICNWCYSSKNPVVKAAGQ